MEKSVHDIAKSLVDGGIEEIDGFYVALKHETFIFNPCSKCEFGIVFSEDNIICKVCMECDSITYEDCFLVLKDQK